MPQMSVLPSRPLATKTSGALKPAASRAVVSPLSRSSTTFWSSRAAKLRDGREIDARPGVDVELVVVREDDVVHAVGVGELREAGAVEVDAVVLREVGILSRDRAAGCKPDLPVGVVHAGDIAHQPVALGDLIFHLAGDAVVEIKVLPTVAFGGPDDLLAVVHVIAELAARRHARPKIAVVEEGLCLFVDESARGAGAGVDLDHLVDLMSALVVLEGESAAVLPPHRRGDGVGVRKERVVDLDMPLRESTSKSTGYAMSTGSPGFA